MDTMTLEEKVLYVHHLWDETIKEYEKNKFRPEPLISTLYHYTNIEGLYGILESDSLWASNINFINDSSEYTYGISLFENVATQKRSKFKSKLLCEVLENITELLNIGKENTYCASFCENKDLLSQWRGYAASSTGVAVGFKNISFSIINKYYEDRVVASISSKPYKVIYGYEEGLKYIEGLFNKLDCFLMNLVNNGDIDDINDKQLIKSLVCSISGIVPLFKDEAFIEENEWRIATCIDNNALFGISAHTKFRTRGNVLLPYISLYPNHWDEFFELYTEEDEVGTGTFDKETLDKFSIGKRLPIKEIIIGPSATQELTASSLKLYIRVKNIDDILVSYSKIPFRG